MKKSTAGWFVLGLAAAGVGFLVFSSPSHAASPGASQTSSAPQRPLQNRPISASASGAAKAAVIRVAQQQLQDMGYQITKIDGISGPETRAAATAFVNDHQAEVESTRSAYASLPNDIGMLYLIDDVYRSRFGLPASTVVSSAP